MAVAERLDKRTQRRKMEDTEGKGNKEKNKDQNP